MIAILLPSAEPQRHLLQLAGRRLVCAVGRGGIRRHKIEGDGATPSGVLPLRRVLYRADRLPAPSCARPLPVEPIAPRDAWCDDPSDPDYNRQVRLPHAARHERLWREDPLYDLLAVLGYNDDPPQPGRGSAIFLHPGRSGLPPSDGCVCLEAADLLWALSRGLSAIEIPAAD